MMINCVSFGFDFCVTQFAMLCRPWEKPSQVPEPEHPVTQTKPTRNDGASHADSDADNQEDQSEEEEELAPKKKRPPRNVLKYLIGKHWVTGESAVQYQDVTRRELEDLMLDLAFRSAKGFWAQITSNRQRLLEALTLAHGQPLHHIRRVSLCAIGVSATLVCEL